MPARLTQLPLAIWLIAGIVVIGLSLLVFWLRRNFNATEVTLKPGPLEVKLERKEITPAGKSPGSVPLADAQATGGAHAAGGAVNINGPSHIGGDVAGLDHITNTTVNMQGGTHIEGGVHTGGGDFVNGAQIKAQTVIKDSVVQLTLPPITALYQMPEPPSDFTGRETELAELRAAMEEGGITISGLQGQGGVGKTALALKLADELKPRYPDAQIYLDLQGVGPNPLKPADAQAYVIHAYHPEAKLPQSEAELGGMYRSALNGQRALLLMDNAKDADQVLPLIPPKGCVLLVTSRLHFTLPGLKARDLDCLPPGDAEKLLLKIAARIDGCAADIAGLCGYLPLALRLAGSALAERSDLAPAGYVQRLHDAGTRLAFVESSLTLSYDLLSHERQRLWRMLAVFPATFDRAAAAAVWALEPDVAHDALGDLVKFSLVEWDEKATRYRLHDLPRLFAGSRLANDERALGQARHAQHYVQVLRDTDTLYMQGGDSILRGLELYDAEWPNVQAGQAWAAAHAWQDDDAAKLCSNYAVAATDYLSWRQHPLELIRWRAAALAAAHRLKDRAAEGMHLGNLGLAYADMGEARRAIEFYEQALQITREMGDRHEEGGTLINLGTAYRELGELRRAIEFYEQGLALARQTDDRRWEGAALGNLGNAYADLGEARRAIEFYEQHLTIVHEMGDQHGEGGTLINLGNAYRMLGEARRAIEFYEQGLALARETGDRRWEGNALSGLGATYRALGEARRAIEFYGQGLSTAREIGDRRGEGNALNNLGIAYFNLGEVRRAIAFHEQALAIDREIGDRQGEGNALNNLGIAYSNLGEARRAIEFYEQGLTVVREIGNRHTEGGMLVNLGTAYTTLGEARCAIEFYEQGLANARETGDRRWEGNALIGLGAAHRALGGARRSIEFYEQALTIAREIGDRRGEGNVLDNLGLAYADLGEVRRAIELYEQRLPIAREIGDRKGEAIASWNLGETYEKEGNLPRAISALQVGVDYEREIGDPDAEKDAAQVDALRAKLAGKQPTPEDQNE